MDARPAIILKSVINVESTMQNEIFFFERKTMRTPNHADARSSTYAKKT